MSSKTLIILRVMEKKKVLLVQGCLDIVHSYSIVLQNQLACWCQHLQSDSNGEKYEIRIQEYPYPYPDWKPDPQCLAKGPLAPFRLQLFAYEGTPVDCVYRISYPYDVSPPPNAEAKLFLFATFEFAKLNDHMFIGGKAALKKAFEQGYLHIITPSNWCLDAFHNDKDIPWDLARPNVSVVPHGVNVMKLKPMVMTSRPFISKFEQDTLKPYVFLSLGAMTSNKGIKQLIKAFGFLARVRNCVLILKGISSLYQSAKMFDDYIAQLQNEFEMDRRLPNPADYKKKIIWLDSNMTEDELTELYNSADCYVTPYLAEGFNIPALEAAACGLPVIATAGGPTDDFLIPECCLKLRSQKSGSPDSNQVLLYSEMDLVTLMEKAMTDTRLTKNALTFGAQSIANKYNWNNVSRQQWDLFWA